MHECVRVCKCCLRFARLCVWDLLCVRVCACVCVRVCVTVLSSILMDAVIGLLTLRPRVVVVSGVGGLVVDVDEPRVVLDRY